MDCFGEKIEGLVGPLCGGFGVGLCRDGGATGGVGFGSEVQVWDGSERRSELAVIGLIWQ